MTSPFLLQGLVDPNPAGGTDAHRPVLMQTLLRNPLIGPVLNKFVSFTLFSKSFSSVFGPDTQPSEEVSLLLFSLSLSVLASEEYG